MSYPKLSIRDIRKHPAVISKPDVLQKNMDVALCYLLPTIGFRTRCAQALMGFAFKPEGVTTRREGLKDGYAHTPTWGIAVNQVATVNWVNTTNPYHEHPYASFRVTQSARSLSSTDDRQYIAAGMAEVRELVQELPPINELNAQDELVTAYELITGFNNLGLAPEPYGLNQFVIDLSKLD